MFSATTDLRFDQPSGPPITEKWTGTATQASESNAQAVAVRILNLHGTPQQHGEHDLTCQAPSSWAQHLVRRDFRAEEFKFRPSGRR